MDTQTGCILKVTKNGNHNGTNSLKSKNHNTAEHNFIEIKYKLDIFFT